MKNGQKPRRDKLFQFFLVGVVYFEVLVKELKAADDGVDAVDFLRSRRDELLALQERRMESGWDDKTHFFRLEDEVKALNAEAEKQAKKSKKRFGLFKF